MVMRVGVSSHHLASYPFYELLSFIDSSWQGFIVINHSWGPIEFWERISNFIIYNGSMLGLKLINVNEVGACWNGDNQFQSSLDDWLRAYILHTFSSPTRCTIEPLRLLQSEKCNLKLKHTDTENTGPKRGHGKNIIHDRSNGHFPR